MRNHQSIAAIFFCAFIFALVLAKFGAEGVEVSGAERTLTLQGEKALEYLKSDGSYQSFVEAYTSVRYSFIDQNGDPNRFYSENDAHYFRADFGDGNAVKISSLQNDWKFDWQLRSVGRGEKQIPLKIGDMNKNGQRVEIERSEISGVGDLILTEWFQNQPDGLEQGFVVHRTPVPGDEKLRLVLTTDSIATATDNGQSLELAGTNNGPVMRYENLKVWDAANETLTASMRVNRNGEILLEVDDRTALYPITINPTFVQAQKIFATNYGTDFGRSFAISGDWMVIGAPRYNVNEGWALIFKRTNNTWEPADILTRPANLGGHFGTDVAINGNTVVVGEPTLNSARGAAHVYKYNGTSFVLVQTLTAQDGVNNHQFGTRLAISGSTIAIGAPGTFEADTSLNGVYIFRETGGSFFFRKKLVPSSANDRVNFGNRVSYNGNTVVVTSGVNQGRVVYVFAGSDTNWVEQARILPLPTSTGTFGAAADVSGETLIIGEPAVTGSTGRAHIYRRNGTFWILEKTVTPNDGGNFDSFGRDVSISGNMAAAGAVDHADGRGAVYVFSRSGGIWAQRKKLTPADGFIGQEFGDLVKVVDNSVYATTATDDNSFRRPIYVFRVKSQVTADFDGDGKTDISVFRPANSAWYLQQSQTG